jgi:diguanylate cyclase (GGDEF)-like protein/PAS domain S-box-containing protein
MTSRDVVAPETERLSALVAVARAVSDTVADERRLASLVVRTVTRLLGDGAIVWLASGTDARLMRAATAHVNPQAEKLMLASRPDIVRQSDDDLIAAVMDSGAPAVLGADEVAAYVDDLDPSLAPWLGRYGVSSTVVLPLRGEGRVSGILVATRDRANQAYTDQEVAFLQALADVAAATLGTAYLLTGAADAVEDMRRQAEVVDQVSDVIIAWDVHYRLVTWNAAAERVYMYSSAEALGCDTETLLATRFIAVDGEELNRDQIVYALAETGGWSGELRQRRADGQEIEILASVTGLFDWQGKLTGAVSVNRDVTDQRRKEQLAMRDALTGLPNRRFLLDHLREGLARCARGSGTLALLFLDLDGFKQVNDTLGHEAGDEVLRVTAQRLTAALRRNDVVARLGGDEFVAVTEIASRDNAEFLARRLIELAGQPIEVGGGVDAHVVPSIGITVVDQERALGLTPDELIREADSAMYVAKRGRSGMAFAS